MTMIVKRWLDADGGGTDDDNDDDEFDDDCQKVVGRTASAGHFSVPRTSGEFSRDIISRSRSPRWGIEIVKMIGMMIDQRWLFC